MHHRGESWRTRFSTRQQRRDVNPNSFFLPLQVREKRAGRELLQMHISLTPAAYWWYVQRLPPRHGMMNILLNSIHFAHPHSGMVVCRWSTPTLLSSISFISDSSLFHIFSPLLNLNKWRRRAHTRFQLRVYLVCFNILSAHAQMINMYIFASSHTRYSPTFAFYSALPHRQTSFQSTTVPTRARR